MVQDLIRVGDIEKFASFNPCQAHGNQKVVQTSQLWAQWTVYRRLINNIVCQRSLVSSWALCLRYTDLPLIYLYNRAIAELRFNFGSVYVSLKLEYIKLPNIHFKS